MSRETPSIDLALGEVSGPARYQGDPHHPLLQRVAVVEETILAELLAVVAKHHDQRVAPECADPVDDLAELVVPEADAFVVVVHEVGDRLGPGNRGHWRRAPLPRRSAA